MIRSMTGFASETYEDDLVSLGVTVRSVNHRYLDVQIRLPSVFAELEHELRGLVQRYVSRGRVELSLTSRLKTEVPVELMVNERLVSVLVKMTEQAKRRGWVEKGLTAGDLLRFPKVVTFRDLPADKGEWQEICKRVADTTGKVLSELDRMRSREGEFLQTDLDERVAAVRSLVDQVVIEADIGTAALRSRLTDRIDDLGSTVQTDSILVAQEVVKWAARSDIHEEVARLRGHFEHASGLVQALSPCGRKLDFLVQEMNREVNTIGSKAQGSEIGKLVVMAKAELEKLREQIQNVE